MRGKPRTSNTFREIDASIEAEVATDPDIDHPVDGVPGLADSKCFALTPESSKGKPGFKFECYLLYDRYVRARTAAMTPTWDNARPRSTYCLQRRSLVAGRSAVAVARGWGVRHRDDRDGGRRRDDQYAGEHSSRPRLDGCRTD